MKISQFQFLIDPCKTVLQRYGPVAHKQNFQLKLIAKQAMQIERITHNPAVMGGKPCIRGLRITVGSILGLLATGKSRERILQAYPILEAEDIDAAVTYNQV